jgi:hypothetical protein
MPLAHAFLGVVDTHDKSRDVRCFQLRDGEANQNTRVTLGRFGFEFGETRINNPPLAGQKVDPTQLARIDTDGWRPEDSVVATTRPAVSDTKRDFKKCLPRAYTDLEHEIINVWQCCLPEVSRGRVNLNPELVRFLPPGFEDRFDMRFRQREGACYLTLQRFGDNRRPYTGNVPRTAAFLLRLPSLPKREFGFVGLWCPDGTSTLALSYLIRYRHADLLREWGFLMAELVCCSPIPKRPTDYHWMLDWQLEPLFHVPLDELPGELRSVRPADRKPRRAA